MATEEVELNEALEHAGVRVVETDLGEFVVQLGGDRPSHIITPIIHRSRQDVAALFQEKLGATAGGRRGHPGHDGPGAARAPRRVPAGRHGHQRRQSRRRRDGQHLHRHQRGEREADDDAAARARGAAGARAHRADRGGPRRRADRARAQRHGPGVVGLHECDHRAAPAGRRARCAAGRRPRRAGRTAHRHSRQRPKPAPRHTAGGDPLLRAMRRVPERVPGLPPGRRPRVRRGVSGAGRLGGHARAARRRGLVGTGACQQPVRRVPGRLPGEDRPAAPAARREA